MFCPGEPNIAALRSIPLKSRLGFALVNRMPLKICPLSELSQMIESFHLFLNAAELSVE